MISVGCRPVFICLLFFLVLLVVDVRDDTFPDRIKA